MSKILLWNIVAVFEGERISWWQVDENNMISDENTWHPVNMLIMGWRCLRVNLSVQSMKAVLGQLDWVTCSAHHILWTALTLTLHSLQGPVPITRLQQIVDSEFGSYPPFQRLNSFVGLSTLPIGLVAVSGAFLVHLNQHLVNTVFLVQISSSLSCYTEIYYVIDLWNTLYST